MRLRRLIKRNAALALRRHWSRAVSISLIILIFWALFTTLEHIATAVFDVPSFVDMSTPEIALDDMPNVAPVAMVVMILTALMYFAVMSPLKLGAARWFYNLTDGRAEPAIELFDSFCSVKKFFRALWLDMLKTALGLFWCVLFLAPPAAMMLLGNHWRGDASRSIEVLLSTGLEILGGILLLLFGWFLIVWLRRYCLAEYMIAADDTISANKALRRSVYLTRGRLTEFVILEITLLGWRIADAFVLPRLFTLPYISAIYSLYSRYLIELNISREPAADKSVTEKEPDGPEEDVPEKGAPQSSGETPDAQAAAENVETDSARDTEPDNDRHEQD